MEECEEEEEWLHANGTRTGLEGESTTLHVQIDLAETQGSRVQNLWRPRPVRGSEDGNADSAAAARNRRRSNPPHAAHHRRPPLFSLISEEH